MIEYVMTQCRPETVKPGGWAAQIWEAVQAGKAIALYGRCPQC
jgi:hypothetical protein